jgi:hypothetical protein
VDPTAAATLALRLPLGGTLLEAQRSPNSTGTWRWVVSQAVPALLPFPEWGTDVAGVLLVAAGDNPERLSSEAAFARLCGVAPFLPPPTRPTETG